MADGVHSCSAQSVTVLQTICRIRPDPEERRQALENAKRAATQGKRPMITTTCLGKIVFSGSSFQEVNRKADD
jgi:hypothetical protein